MPKSSSKAVEVMKAGERMLKLNRKVGEAERALVKAQQARDRADARYLALASEAFAGLQKEPVIAGQEGNDHHA